MLTARDSVPDIVRGLDVGADDYLTKPFSFEVLAARLRVIARLFRFSVKWRGGAPLLVSVPPLRGGDFQGIRVYRSDAFWGRARRANLRARHRLDEPAKLSLSLVASLQSPLPFRLANSL
jgi:DNA-binding response OmpR family regulator